MALVLPRMQTKTSALGRQKPSEHHTHASKTTWPCCQEALGSSNGCGGCPSMSGRCFVHISRKIIGRTRAGTSRERRMNWVTSLGEETPEHYLVTILDRKLKHMKTSPGHTLPSAALAPQSSTLPVSDLLAEASCMPSLSTDGMPSVSDTLVAPDV